MRTRPHSLGLPAGLLALALAAALPAASPSADAATLAGVTMPDRESAGDQELVLNGMGLRSKLFIKVYVGGLYLAERQASADRVLAADAPRVMVMHYLYGVSKDQLCEGWDEGLEDNTPNASAEVKRGFTTLCDWMTPIAKGEELRLTYVPGTGTTVTAVGQDKGTIPGKDFADALLRCWIGPDPGPGEGFKKAVLGG